MATLTLTKTPTETVPDFDRTDGDQLADEVILESARSAKVDRVTGRGNGARQSADAQAWTKSGQVD